MKSLSAMVSSLVFLGLAAAPALAAPAASKPPSVRIAVDSAGTGFAVQVSAKDAKTAEEVLRRARLLQGQFAK